MKKREIGKKPFSLLCSVALVASLCLPTAALADVGAGTADQGTNVAQAAGGEQGANSGATGDADSAAAGKQAGEAVADDAVSVAEQSADQGLAVQAAGVAAIGDTQYATLQGAIDAAKDGDTIKLLTDASITDSVLTINKQLTIDLGNNKISGNGYFDIYGSLVLKNGEISYLGVDDEKSHDAIWLNGKASLTVEKSLKISVSKDKDYAIGFWSDCNGANLNFFGAIEGGNGISTNGLIDATAANSIVVDGASINVADHGIYQAGMASTSFAISNSTINAGKTGIEVRSGNLVVDNCIIAGGKGELVCEKNPGGPTTYNAGIAIAQHTTKQAINVQVNGGSISGKYAIYESNPQGNSAEDISKVKLSVTGGMLNGDIYSEDVAGFVTGGTFSTQPNASYVADGYVAVGAGDHYQVVKKQASAGDKESKTEGSAAVTPSDINPAISDDSANALAGSAAAAADSLKKDDGLPGGLSVSEADLQKLKQVVSSAETGDTVSATLLVSANSSSQEDSKIKGELADGEEAAYIDLSIYLQLDVLDANGVVKDSDVAKVTQLPSDVEVTVAVNPDFIKGKNVRIARNHDGKVDFITPTKVDYATGAVTFKTDRFSSYAVVASEPATVYEVHFVDKFNDTETLQQVESGKTAAKPADPSFEGYEFVGWFTDEAATSLYDFSTPVTGELTLYAGYKKIEPAPAGDNGQAGNGDNGGKPAADAPAATALAQTGDNAVPIALGAIALGAALIAAGALVLRRRGQR